MTDKKSNISKRKLIKSIAVGSGAIVAGKSLPESWSKPIVDSVMLPAHAQTSTPTTTPAPCDDPVLDQSNVVLTGDFVIRDPSGQTSGGTATGTLSNTSSVPISISENLVVTPPSVGISFSVTTPGTLQPGASGDVTISTTDNLCQFDSGLTLEITAASTDAVCQGSVVISVPVGYQPAC